MTNPLDKLTHSTPNSDPAKQRELFMGNVEHPSEAWEGQKPSLDKWKMLEGSVNLERHEVQHLPSKNDGASAVFSKRAHELGIYNTKIHGKKH